MAERIAAFLLWAAVAACAVFWGLRVLVTAKPVPSQAAPVSVAAAARGDVVRLFANPAATTAAQPEAVDPGLASRFKLIGVVAPKAGSEQGIALIAVDGKPPRPYRVGARLDRGLVLQSVATRSAAIGPVEGATAVRLDLPPPQAATTGSLPPLPSNDDPGVLPRQPSAATPQAAPVQPQVPPPAPPQAQQPPTQAPSQPQVQGQPIAPVIVPDNRR